jgi:hypothetical protein
MFKIKKRPPPAGKMPVLYNVIEDYTEFDAPGNVTLCAMTEPEDLPTHARVLAESYDIPVDIVTRLLNEGGIYVYPQCEGLVTRGVFQCWMDADGVQAKQTWLLDLVQYAEAEQLSRAYGLPLEQATHRVFIRTLPASLQERLKQKNLGLDYKKLERAVVRGGDLKYIDFRKDWSAHFKRLCIMPDGQLVPTSGLEEFAALHGITSAQARTLLEQGGILEVDGEVLSCQIVNGQPAVARFNRTQYGKAKDLVASRGLHIMDALSEVGLSDPLLMGALRRKERGL